MKAKEEWIKSTLGSIDSIRKPEVNPELSEKIISGISQREAKIISIQPMVKWVAAACIILLVGLNIISLLQYKNNSTEQSSTSPVYKEYFSYLNTF